MRVYRHPPRWDTEEQPYHVVEKTGWLAGLEKSLLTYQVTAFCDAKFLWEKKSIKYKIEEYKKNVHRKKLCPECVRLVKLRLQNRSLKTESEK